MPEELAVSTEPIETTVDTTEVEDAAQPVEGEESAAETGADGEHQESVEDVKGDGRTLPQYIRNMKATDPQGYKEAKALFFAKRDFDQNFPGGVQEARELIGFIAENGGKEGLLGFAAEAKDFQGLTEAMTTGNVQTVLDRVAEVAPEFIAQAAPEMMSRYYQADPEGCNRMLCGVVANTLAGANFDGVIDRIGLLLEVGRTEDALATIANLKQWADGIRAQASSAPQQRTAPKNDQFAQRERELNDRETQQMVSNYRTQMTQFMEPMIREQAKTLGYDLTDRQLQMLYKEVATAADGAVGKEGLKLINSHLSRKDVTNAVKMAQSRYGQVLPDVIKKEAGELFRMPTKAKPAVVATPKPDAKPKPTSSPSRAVDPFAERFGKIFAT